MDTPRSFYLLPQVSWLTDRMMTRMAMAYSLSLARFAYDHDIPIPSVGVASRAADIPDDASPVVYQQTMPIPGDEAYHTMEDGRPASVVLADPDQMELADVEEAGNHEVKEASGDPDCQGYILLPNGWRISKEWCDCGQNMRVMCELNDGGLPVATANHATKYWAMQTPPDGVAFDVAGGIRSSLWVGPSGYALIMSPVGAVSMVGPGPILFDALGLVTALPMGPNDPHPKASFAPPAWKRHPAFRFGRRLAAMHALGAQIAGAS